jgi:myo-inositol-1-phosphate synthase
VFFDGQALVPKLHAVLLRRLRLRGVLLTANLNLNHGGTTDAVWEALLGRKVTLSALVERGPRVATSVKL